MAAKDAEEFDLFLEGLRKEALMGDFGADAIWREHKKAYNKIQAYNAERGGKPEFIETLQALVLFAANQPDLKFLTPYFYQAKSEKEVQEIFSAFLEDEIEEYDLNKNWQQANLALVSYEQKRNREYWERVGEAIAKKHSPRDSDA